MDKIKLFLSSVILFFSLSGLCPAQEEAPVEPAAEVVVEDADAATDETADAPEKKSLRQKGKDWWKQRQENKAKKAEERKARKEAAKTVAKAEAREKQEPGESYASTYCWILGGMWLITLPAVGMAVYRRRLLPVFASVGCLIGLTLAVMFWYGIYFEESIGLVILCLGLPGFVIGLPIAKDEGFAFWECFAFSDIFSSHDANSFPFGCLLPILYLILIVAMIALLGALAIIFTVIGGWGWGVYHSFCPEKERVPAEEPSGHPAEGQPVLEQDADKQESEGLPAEKQPAEE